MKAVKTIIVDDVESMHKALKDFTQTELNCEVIAEAFNGMEFLDLENQAEADIILMDIEMPEMDGVNAARQILWKYPYLRIIAITMYQDKVYLKGLIEAGFKGCVFKQNIFSELEQAISVVLAGKVYFPESMKL